MSWMEKTHPGAPDPLSSLHPFPPLGPVGGWQEQRWLQEVLLEGPAKETLACTHGDASSHKHHSQTPAVPQDNRGSFG